MVDSAMELLPTVPCPHCGAHGVDFDYVLALTFCETCGYVVDDVHLDSHLNAGGGGGSHVGATDDGTFASASPAGVPPMRSYARLS